MLSPDELSVLPEVVSKLYSRLEKFTIAEIARRIMNTGKLTETALHQMRALQHSGQDLKNIENEIKRTLKISTEKLDMLYDDAILRAQEYDKDIYSKTDLLPALENNYAEMLSFAEVLKAQAQGELYNFTRSMGFTYKSGGAVKFKPIAGFYQDTLDFALFQVRSGVLTVNEAVKQAVDKMAESGIKVVDYESGAVRSVEAAVRTAVYTGLSQISGKVTEQTMRDFDTDLVEVTAHEGARDKGDDFRNHKSWQGKVYSLKGDRPDYPNLASVTGYGDVAGLKGANCRHDMHAFIEGVSVRAWTDEELANIVKRTSKVLNMNITDDAAIELAKRSRKTPRIANRLFKRVRDFALVEGDGLIDLNITLNALERLNVDTYGLDNIDIEYLEALINKFNGGPVGVETISTAIGEEVSTIEDVVEPFLLQEGFIKRTRSGRVACEKAYKHLGIDHNMSLF